MASLDRRKLLTSAGALAVAGCRPGATTRTVERTPRLDMERLNREVGRIAAGMGGGRLGAALMNLDSSEVFAFRRTEGFPMQSVFKAPLAAAVLAEVDAGRLALDQRFTLEEMDLSPPWSPIAEAWPGRRDYTTAELLSAAVSASDNTAADVLMARIGGPGAVTAWLASKQIDDIHIDRYEREIQTAAVGLAPFRPAWRSAQAFEAARRTVPLAQQRAAMAAYLADPRDTATPVGVLEFLDDLDDYDLLSAASTRLLLRCMAEARTGSGRILAGLPKGSTFAHKTGTGPRSAGTTSAINDIGIATLPDKRRYSMAVFVAGASAPASACEALIAEVARAFVRGVR
jgi:beta-lactamase class A